MAKLILVIEDDRKSLKLVRDLLGTYGYSTIEATDGEEGIKLAQKRHPALIIMDVQLPVIDGLECTRMLKANAVTRNIPIIVVTSYAMDGDEERAYQAGCDGYLTKPVDIHELLAEVEKHLLAKNKRS